MIVLDLSIGLSIGAAVGYIIRELIGDRLARDRALDIVRITEFNKAAATFHAAFVDIIVRLRRNVQTAEFHYTNIPTSTDLVDHEKAKIIFEPYLAACKLEGFNIAWEKYKNSSEDYMQEFKPTAQTDLSIEAAGELGRSHRKRFSQYCLNHLSNLLEYAKPKI